MSVRRYTITIQYNDRDDCTIDVSIHRHGEPIAEFTDALIPAMVRIGREINENMEVEW